MIFPIDIYTEILKYSDKLTKINLSKVSIELHSIIPIKERIYVSSDKFNNAVKSGNLQKMKWLYDNKCPWNCYTFPNAAQNGNLENMNWLRENGCPTN